MNELNYASLEASKKLHDADIILETDAYFRIFDGETVFVTAWQKKCWEDEIKVDAASDEVEFIPAPCMAEVWRELPECITKGGTIQYLEMGKTGSKTYAAYDFADDYILFDNPTDALIDLLIWVKEQNKDRIVNKLLDRADKLKW